MCEEIGNYKVSGTPDVIYFEDDMWIVGDYKTKGTFQMRKSIIEGVDDVKLQMSIYAYLWSKHKEVPMPLIGEVYLIHVGDKGYYVKDEVKKLGMEGRVPVPKYFTATVGLYGTDEVEKIVAKRARSIEAEPLVDCPEWKCNYCWFECEHRGRDVNDQF
jgi:CRISPR/Cas system-associated exonuclease Cas4 (RecB family)